MAWIFEPHGLFRQPPFDNEEPWPIGYISEGVGQPLFALHEVIGERPVEELLAASLVMTAAPELLDACRAVAASGMRNAAYDACVAAISKATGEAK